MPEFKIEKKQPELVSLDKIVPFGKYKGLTIKKIIDSGDLNYIDWLQEKEIFELNCDAEDYLEESRPVELDIDPDGFRDYLRGEDK